MNISQNIQKVKPKIILPNLDKTPAALQEYDQWVCWKPKKKADGKIDKIPINPTTGSMAKTNDPTTWGTYARCVKYYKNHKKTIAGIGFVLTKDDPFSGGDLDGCRDLQTGEITQDAQDLLREFNTYSEASPSATGIRFFCLGELPGKGVSKDGIELYDTGRFLTITGHCLDEYGITIQDRQEELSELYEKLGGNTGTGRNTYGWQDELLGGVPESERHNTAMRLAGRLAVKDLSPSEVALFITAWNQNNDPPKPELSDPESKELQDIISYAFADKLFGSETETPEKIIEDLNKKHGVIMLSGKCCVLNEDYCPVYRRGDVSFSSKTDFLNYYANQKTRLPGSDKPISIGPLWWNSSNRRQYKGIVNEPGNNVLEGYYNLWRGFSVEPQKGDWSLMKRLIRDGIASGIQSRYEYILSWVARIFQDPGGFRPGVAIVMRGLQGVGKGEFGKHCGSLLGRHYIQVAQGSQVTGQFNSHMKDCVLLFVDEAVWAGDNAAAGVIKNLVTEPMLNIEPKGKEIIRIKSNVNILIASNNSWVVPAGKDERRFFTIDVSNAFKGDYAFFKALNEQMKNGGRAAMLYDLLNRDLSGVDLRDFERTDALLDQILESMTPVESWWYGRLNEGVASDYMNFDDDEDWPENILNEHLYQDFMEWAKELKRYVPNQDVFARELNKLITPVQYRRKLYNGMRRRFRILPSLDECRAAFEKLLNMQLTWDAEEDMRF